jgi:hypothetical protein
MLQRIWAPACAPGATALLRSAVLLVHNLAAGCAAAREGMAVAPRDGSVPGPPRPAAPAERQPPLFERLTMLLQQQARA